MSQATLASLLPLAVAIPITGAVAAPLAARLSRRLPLLISVAAASGSTVVLCLVAPRVYGGHVLAHYLGHWVPVGGKPLGVGFAADAFGLTFALATSAIGVVLLIYTLSEIGGGLAPRELGGYTCLFQLMLAGLIGAALTADLFNLFVWFEVASLSSYGLTGFFLERPIALEAAFKLLVLKTLASFAIFIGVGLLYAEHGALNFGQLQHALAGHVHRSDLVALGLLVAGFATKAGLVPFHGWLPDAHTAAPGSVSALFSGLMVNLGIVALGRIGLQLYGPHGRHHVLGLLMAIGLASALAGSLLALAQDDLKRLLAYDTVSQMGILAVGLSTADPGGVAGAAYHLVNHALFKALLFLCAGAILTMTGATRLSQMGGLARRKPLLTAVFTLAVLAIAGVPPLNGYASLGLIHDALQKTGHPVVLAGVLVAQIFTIAALGRAAYLGFYRPRPEPYETMERLRPGMLIGMCVLGAGCLAFGLAPGIIVHHVAAPAASSLLHPGSYATGILAGGVRLPHQAIAFDYFKPEDMLLVAATVVLGVALARWYLRTAEPVPIRALRSLQTGSVNDYAAYAVLGLLIAVVALLV
ncbi:MAG TPA: proton-conducting transporter membrane subunit [Gaiellaceae bacterium]